MEDAHIALREQEVSSVRTVGIQLRATIAFVLLTIFKTLFGCSPEDVDMKVVTLLGFSGKPVDGGCFRLVANWPDKIPYFEAVIFSESTRVLLDVVLPKGRVLRDEHAKDRYEVSCSAMMKARAAHLQQDELAILPHVVTTFKNAKTFGRQKQKAMEDSFQNAESGVATQGAEVVGVSSLVEADAGGGGGGIGGSKARKATGKKAAAKACIPRKQAKHFPARAFTNLRQVVVCVIQKLKVQPQ